MLVFINLNIISIDAFENVILVTILLYLYVLLLLLFWVLVFVFLVRWLSISRTKINAHVFSLGISLIRGVIRRVEVAALVIFEQFAYLFNLSLVWSKLITILLTVYFGVRHRSSWLQNWTWNNAIGIGAILVHILAGGIVALWWRRLHQCILRGCMGIQAAAMTRLLLVVGLSETYLFVEVSLNCSIFIVFRGLSTLGSVLLFLVVVFDSRCCSGIGDCCLVLDHNICSVWHKIILFVEGDVVAMVYSGPRMLWLHLLLLI